MSQAHRVGIDGDQAVIELTGELDIARAAELRTIGEAALSDGLARIVLDLREVTFIDSSGIGAIVHLNNLARQRGKHLALRNTTHGVQRVLNLAGLSGVFGAPADPT